MGNQQCCQAGNKGEDLNQKVDQGDYRPEILPALSEPIKKLLHSKKPFEKKLSQQNDIVTRQYGDDFYEGPIDSTNRPHGYGKMYRKDGSLVISQWNQGSTHGPSIFIFPDASYYEGLLIDNKADDSAGRYVNSQIAYEGGFHGNAFHGKGKQNGPGYSFEGDYINGRKAKGTLKWQQDSQPYEYSGEFNQNFQFQNEGTLKEGKVGVYQGQFKNGKKNGKGVYTYIKNDVRYEGEYKDGLKSGHGTVYNHDNTIAYSGGFQRDLPNGEGYIIDNGKKTYALFKDGIDIERLPA